MRPLVLRDVPAQRLAYRFEPDITVQAEILKNEPIERLAPILTDFESNRSDHALLRTVVSPDGQRALALYSTEEDARQTFRIDMYAADGKFLRNLTPPALSCVFPETVAWSSDGNFITFIARKSVLPTPSPTPPPGAELPETDPSPSPSVAPAFPAVQTFTTEQIYICNRDGFDLKPLTTRDGLIYFYLSWAPDSHALVALACKEDEWDAREKAFRLPAGRPRLINLDGKERLLDDQLTECLPAWSADSSKVGTAFDTDVAIYDAGGTRPTQARIPLRELLLKASVEYEEKNSKKKESGDGKGSALRQDREIESTALAVVQGTRALMAFVSLQSAEAQGQGSQAQGEGSQNSLPQTPPPSFNPIVRFEWPSPETVYIQTAYVRVYTNETINTFQRWHRLTLSPQAAVLK